jgi:hypothetical protein
VSAFKIGTMFAAIAPCSSVVYGVSLTITSS